MCGRFVLGSWPDALLKQLNVQLGFDFEPRFNVAPTQDVLAVRQLETHADREAARLRWGLVPFWADDLAIGNRMINARSDTVASKPAFRKAFQRRRCLVLADGFYEWQAQPGSKTKQPFLIRLAGGQPFAFAGLWERWQRGDEPAVESCTILTTEPNELVAPIHNRMPVILAERHYNHWLDPEFAHQAELQKMLAPYDAEQMETFPVSKAVNNPKHDAPDCVEPIATNREFDLE